MYTEAKMCRHNPLGTGAEDETAHLFTVYFTCFSWFIIYESLNLYDTQHIEFGWMLSCPFSHLQASMCLSAYLALRGLFFVRQNMSAMQTLFLPLFSHFRSLFLCLSSYIFVIRLVPFILWSFIQSLKHFKLWWWLANLSQINLMGSACTHSPHGCAFTAVLLIYSWKTTLQCPSFKIG